MNDLVMMQYAKNGSNRRSATPRIENRPQSYGVIFLWAFILVCAFIAVWSRWLVADIGYEFNRTRTSLNNVVRENDLLKVERTRLTSQGRLEFIGAEYGYTRPADNQIIRIQPHDAR